jgi:hypothetical protein
MWIAKVQEMSLLSYTWKNQQSEFRSSRAESAVGARAWRLARPRIKELCRITLALAACLAMMAAFVGLGVWIWVPYSHQ